MFMSIVFTTLSILTTTTTTVQSCGISTHISIANQALQSFLDDEQYHVSYRNIIVENLDAFYAGSTYPDAFYSSLCFDGYYHSISEDTHWAPFLNASINYIRRKYQQPWNKETKKLVAFIFGVTSHQVADITWHSLNVKQGFLQVMAKMNFHGSFGAAHPVGDTGGDMVSIFEGDLQGVMSLASWYVPLIDLMNIYRDLYSATKINEAVLFTCSELLYIGAIGEHYLGADLFSMFAKKSPFLVENLHNYFIGGKSDMAAWSANIWYDLTYMFEKGTTSCQIPRNTLLLQCPTKEQWTRGKRNVMDNYINNKNIPRGKSLIYLDHVKRNVITNYTPRGVYFQYNINKKENMRENNFDFSKMREREREGNKELNFFTNTSYANLGWCLSTGILPYYKETLIMSAPWLGFPGNGQHGRIYVISSHNIHFHMNETAIDIDETADQVFDGKTENGRFGYSFTLLDFNADGLNDLAVSAPSEGSNELNYTGKVFIYFGNSKYGLNKTADVVIIGDEHYYNLGTTLLGEDLNQDGYKDLIIGSKYAAMDGEQKGSVVVFLSGKKEIAAEYFVNQADIILCGEQNYSWFGSFVAFHNETSIGQVLFVSAPTFRICAIQNCSFSSNDVQSVGKIYAYQWSRDMSMKLIFVVTGQEIFAKMGTSFVVGDPFGKGINDILAISSTTAAVNGHLPLDIPTTFDQAGHVCLVNLTELFYKRNSSLTKDDCITKIEGNRNYGRFGWHLSLQDVNHDNIKDLIIGAPYFTENINEINEGEEGAVYVFYGGTSFPRGDATLNCDITDVQPCPEKKASWYQASPQKYGHFGEDVATMKMNDGEQWLIVSSPRKSDLTLHNGAVTVYQLKELRGEN